MDIKQQILQTFPAWLAFCDLAKLLGTSTEAVRARVGAQKSPFDKALAATRIWIGRRVYFQTAMVAEAISAEARRQIASGDRRLLDRAEGALPMLAPDEAQE